MKKDFAIWFPWYGASEFKNPRMPLHPLRAYSSDDERIMRVQVKLAQQAGIDGWAFSLWNDPQHNANIAKMFEVAKAAGFGMLPLIEGLTGEQPQVPLSQKELIDRVKPLRGWWDDLYRMEGGDKPLALFYGAGRYDRHFLPEFPHLKIIADGNSLDLLERYNGLWKSFTVFSESIDRANAVISTRCHDWDWHWHHDEKMLCALDVMPGYNNTWSRPDGMEVPRDNGRKYDEMWQSAIDSQADIAIIGSFNEWREQTAIEPSKEEGSKYLNMTARWTEKFRKSEK